MERRDLFVVLQAVIAVIPEKALVQRLAVKLQPIKESLPYCAPEYVDIYWGRVTAILAVELTPHQGKEWHELAVNIFNGKEDYRKHL